MGAYAPVLFRRPSPAPGRQFGVRLARVNPLPVGQLELRADVDGVQHAEDGEVAGGIFPRITPAPNRIQLPAAWVPFAGGIGHVKNIRLRRSCVPKQSFGMRAELALDTVSVPSASFLARLRRMAGLAQPLEFLLR